MKITINRESLLKRLAVSHAILANNPQPPIAGSSYIWIDNGNMRIKTTNTQTNIEVFLPIVKVEGDEAPFICDTRSIQRVIQTLNAEEIYINVEDKKITFGIEGGRRKVFEIPLKYGADSFPKMPQVDNAITFKVNGPMFFDIISKTAKFVPMKNAVHAEGFLIEQDTDGFVYIMAVRNEFMAVSRFKIDGTIPDKIIVPVEISSIIDSFKNSPDVEITISNGGKYFSMFDGATKVTSRNLDSRYVNPLQVFKAMNSTSNILVNKVNLSGAVQRTSSMILGGDTSPVVFDIIGTDLNVETKDIDYSRSASESIEIDENNDCTIRIGFNGKYVMPMLSCLVSEKIRINFSNPNGLTMITDIDQKTYDLKFIVMPMLLNN